MTTAVKVSNSMLPQSLQMQMENLEPDEELKHQEQQDQFAAYAKSLEIPSRIELENIVKPVKRKRKPVIRQDDDEEVEERITKTKKVKENEESKDGKNKECSEDLKVRLRIKINRFLSSQRFGEYLQSLGWELEDIRKRLPKMNLKQLQDMNKQINGELDDKLSAGFIPATYFTSMSLLENISKTTRMKKYLDLSGFVQGDGVDSGGLINDNAIHDCLERLEIENGSFGALPPFQQLLLLTGFAAVRTSAMNRRNNVQSNTSQIPLSNSNKASETVNTTSI